MEHSLFLPETRISDSARSLPSTEKRLHLVYEFALPNYAFERTGKSLAVGAAGASEYFAPAAPGNCRRAAAQRRR